MALGPVQSWTPGGITPSYATPGATENLGGGRNYMLHVTNSGGGAGTVTLVDGGVSPAGNAGTSVVDTIPATTGNKMIFVSSTLTNPATGNIQITFSGGTLLGAVFYL